MTLEQQAELNGYIRDIKLIAEALSHFIDVVDPDCAHDDLNRLWQAMGHADAIGDLLYTST